MASTIRSFSKRFLGTCVLAFAALLTNCEGYESSIPAMPVYLKCNLYLSSNLKDVGGFHYVTKAGGTDRIGFGGILIVHAFDGNYYAFDLACPVEAKENVRIGKPDESLICTCDSCGEQYDTGLGLGSPLKGISKEYLRRYSVSLDENNNIIVTR